VFIFSSPEISFEFQICSVQDRDCVANLTPRLYANGHNQATLEVPSFGDITWRDVAAFQMLRWRSSEEVHSSIFQTASSDIFIREK
jgi:hypothetical protein